MSWKDGEEHIPKLAEFLKWDIAEGFVVYKGKKDLEGFLVQVAYDPFKHKMGEKIDRDHFTGMIIHADINENPLRAWRYLDGKLDVSFDSEANKGARTQQCITTYYSYQTVTGQSCGPNCSEITVTLHQGTQTICDGGGYPYGSGAIEGYPYYPGGGGGGGGGWNGTSTPTYSYTTPYVDYDFNMIARHEGIDYQTFMQKFNRTLDVLGIAGISFGLPATYMDAVLKGLGIKDAVIQEFVTVPKAATSIGWFGFGVGGVQAIIGLTDGDITENDKLNAIAAGLSFVAVMTPIGWVSLTVGALSAGISIYTLGNPSNP